MVEIYNKRRYKRRKREFLVLLNWYRKTGGSIKSEIRSDNRKIDKLMKFKIIMIIYYL